MADTPNLLSPMQRAFRQAGKATCNRYAELKSLTAVQQLPSVTQNVEQIRVTSKSSAQVETSVEQQAVQHSSGGLKPVKSRPSHIGIRLSQDERELVVQRAEQSRLTVSEYARASILGAGYISTLDPVKQKLLRDINRELGRQGNNLNQIAKQLNAEIITEDQGNSMLATLGRSLLATHQSVRQALAKGQVEE